MSTAPRPQDIFTKYTGHLGQAITDPVSIAAELYQNAVIPLGVKEKAEMIPITASERTAQMMTVVNRSIRADLKPPGIFLRAVNVLENHTETAAIARNMKSDYCTWWT